MSRLVARIMLAILMMPLAVLIYVPTLIVFMELFGIGEEWAFWCANLVTATFVIAYWILLWRSVVPWTSGRSGLLMAAGIACLAAGLIAGLIGTELDRSFGVFIGAPVAVILWLIATVLIWRETPAERAARLRMRGADAVVCPACGYNLTGLRTTSCPECGASYTIDELLGGQPSRDAEELTS